MRTTTPIMMMMMMMMMMTMTMTMMHDNIPQNLRPSEGVKTMDLLYQTAWTYFNNNGDVSDRPLRTGYSFILSLLSLFILFSSYYSSADSKMKEPTMLGFIHSFFRRFENRTFKKSCVLETTLIYKRVTPKCISKRFKYHITYHVKAWIFELNLQIVFK